MRGWLGRGGGCKGAPGRLRARDAFIYCRSGNVKFSEVLKTAYAIMFLYLPLDH